MTFQKGHAITNTGRTWWKKGRTPWNKGKNYELEHARRGWFILCIVCGKSKYYQLNEHKKRARRYCSLKCYHIDSRKDELAYSSIHSRIFRDWGKADKCEACNITKTIDWANISGKYLLERKDWKKLCRKCHIKYDKQKNNLAYKHFLSLRR